jgi:hypothetical protein
MYEMQRPRQPRDAVPPISQRPLRRSATIRGQQPRQCSSRPDHRLARDSPGPGGPGIPRHQMTRGFPQSQEAPSNSRAVAQGFLLPYDPGFPPEPRAQVFPSPRWLRAFFSPRGSGFPLRQLTRSFPFAGWLRGFPLCRVAPGSSLARGRKIAHCRVARGFPRAGWLRVSSAPTAPGFSLPEGPDLPFAGWLGVSPLPVARGFPFAGYLPVVGKFLRLSPGPHKGFRAAISRFFGRPQAIHS